jgi:hypothetical protein
MDGYRHASTKRTAYPSAPQNRTKNIHASILYGLFIQPHRAHSDQHDAIAPGVSIAGASQIPEPF